MYALINNENCNIYNIFTIYYHNKNKYRCLFIGFFFFLGVCGENSLNLNPQFKLLFFLSITTNNNLPLKIYYKNVMDITFLFNNTNFTTFLQMITVVMAQSNIF